MRAIINFIVFLSLAITLSGCNYKTHTVDNQNAVDWKSQLKEKLTEFGHRNWILLVDKAFPSQNADGITILNTGEDLLDVLNFTLQEIDRSTHVSPIVYTDKELSFLTSDLVGNIGDYRSKLEKSIGKYNAQALLHDSVFVKIDEASKLFEVLVLKTNETIPYSSVFIELDCKYWSGKNENLLRNMMAREYKN